ncbi:MAG: pyridoxamine 5'-phosphate oxidase family protein [Acidimicrobiales bacterium]
MEWHDVVGFLDGAGLAHLATSSITGRPHVSVVSPAVEGEVLWFATTTTSQKARNLASNPRAALMWQPRAEIYLSGRVVLIADEAEKRRLWESGLFPFDLAAFWGSPANPQLVFVRVEPESAVVMSMGPGGITRQTWRRVGPSLPDPPPR